MACEKIIDKLKSIGSYTIFDLEELIMRKKDIVIIKMKEYNPPIHFDDDFIHYYHNGFMDAFTGETQNNQHQAWSKGYEDGLDSIARPK